MSSTWGGVNIRPWEDPWKPCIRRGGSMSVHGKDQGNHVFDVGGDRCPPIGRTQRTMSSTWGSMSVHGKDQRNHVFDVRVDVRPWEGLREPCLRRGRGLMSVHGKDQGNHVLDVGGRCPPIGRTQGTISSTWGSMSVHGKDQRNHLRRAGRCPPMGRTQGTMSSTWGPHPPMGRTKGTMFSTSGSISAHEKGLLRRGTCNGVLAKQQCLGSLLGSRQLGEHQPGHQRLSRPFTRAAHCYTCCT